MIKITIVDDHSIVRSGLVKILKEESDMMILAETSGYAELFASLKVAKPDIILLDISIPGKNGLEILKEVKQYYQSVKVLMLSMHPEDRFAVRAIKAGASGYVTKESASEELVNYFEILGNKPEHEKLSDRELQIMNMIASGKKVKEIADELSLSPATIATYRARVLEKMNLKSNVELANYALRHNLVD
jgi:two-component system invasion response regulator UvrY